MRISFLVGWWLLPLLITVASYAWALPMRENERPTGGMFSGLGYAIGGTLRLLVATVASLLCWLAWALLAT